VPWRGYTLDIDAVGTAGESGLAVEFGPVILLWVVGPRVRAELPPSVLGWGGLNRSSRYVYEISLGPDGLRAVICALGCGRCTVRPRHTKLQEPTSSNLLIAAGGARLSSLACLNIQALARTQIHGVCAAMASPDRRCSFRTKLSGRSARDQDAGAAAIFKPSEW